MRRIRILYQVFFFGLFLFLVGVMDLTYMKGYPVRWFLEVDPLVALATSLSTHSLYHGLIWSLLLVVVTVLFGRVFCGWVCPLGTLNHFAGAWLDGRSLREKIDANRFRPLYNLKYYLLAALLVMAVGHSLQIGWLDPIPFITRSAAVFLQPMSQWIGQASGLDSGLASGVAVGIVLIAAGLGWLLSCSLERKKAEKNGQRDKSSRARRLLSRHLGDALLAGALAAGILVLVRFSPVEQRRFHWGFWIAALFLLVLGLNRLAPRFWCRALCPLGALLGLIAKFGLWRIHRDPQSCTGCGRCVAECQGACDPDGSLRKSECLGCMNCLDVCPEKSITYRFLPPVEGERRPSPDLGRRRLLGASAVGGLWVLGVRVGGKNARRAPRDVIRPPGSLPEPEFLERCLKCGACMRVCPTNAIQPALAEAGIEGLWTPILVFRMGACELDCTLCGQVCPTGAIRPITRDEKRGQGQWEGSPIRLGTAFFDRGRCLPWATGTPCVVCQEVCPVSPKAIYTTPAQFRRRDGTTVEIGLPHVDPALCIGCGICERECPVHDHRAIRVSSVGESRSVENQMLLSGSQRSGGGAGLD